MKSVKRAVLKSAEIHEISDRRSLRIEHAAIECMSVELDVDLDRPYEVLLKITCGHGFRTVGEGDGTVGLELGSPDALRILGALLITLAAKAEQLQLLDALRANIGVRHGYRAAPISTTSTSQEEES